MRRPLSLLFYFAEQSGAQPVMLHAFGICLLTGRLLHAWGASQARENHRFRGLGMTLTFLPSIAASLRLLYSSVASV